MKVELHILFERHVKRSSYCWEWTGYRDADGYGTMHMYEGAKRKTVKAHRVSWELTHGQGSIPGRLCVLHCCDNPGCVRPEHLFLGTIDDNNRDTRDKGRGFLQSDRNPAKLGMFWGEKNGRALLTEEQVRAIRERHAVGEDSYRYLGLQYGVRKWVIYAIVKRKTWKHV